MWRWKSVWLEAALVVGLLCFAPSSYQANKDDEVPWFLQDNCEIYFRSEDGRKNGTFQSPNYPKPYSADLRCIFRFIGLPGERVQINFTDFRVKGVPPRCLHDYIDVYTDVRNLSEDLLDIPHHGRYCGNDIEVLPHLLISTGNAFIIGFYSDDKKQDKGFKGDYAFIDGSKYIVGTPAYPDICGQIIKSESVPRGTLLSPTYPGMYPDNMFCFYKLQGQAGQRIKFTFIDLDLYSGGEHCPFDHVKVFDGYTREAELIGVYCGRYKNIEIFSTTEALHIDFETQSGRVEPTKKPYVPYYEIEEDTRIERRGFNSVFEFSNKFVDLSFITEGYHVRGTECDQRVLSSGETNGTIKSPNYPNAFPTNITCRYYIDGLVDRHNLEKAKLTFEYFDLPSPDKCKHGFMAAFLQGQDITTDRPDQVFCGSNIPPSLISNNPRLLLVLNTTGSYPGLGFKAHYQFLTDYAIVGTPATDTRCHFIYRSKSQKSGRFNSPRNPSNYPPDTNCTYEFIGLPSEEIRITFESFEIENRFDNCSTDYIKLYSVSKKPRIPPASNQTLIGRYCGRFRPGPVITEDDDSSMKVFFHSDHEGYKMGFRAKYEFIERKPYISWCNSNIERGGGGIVQSPNYPLKYLINTMCEWRIHSRWPEGRILLLLDTFSMEGKMDSGCANAVLKVYVNSSAIPAHELCGPDADLPVRQIVSDDSFMKIRFISAETAVGAKGFHLTWTEILPTAEGFCGGFKCKESGFCIAEVLKCNNLPNCGFDDISDEADCHNYSDNGVLHIIIGVVIALVLLVFILVCVLHRRRKAHKKKHKEMIEVRYVTRGGGGMSERDRMISNTCDHNRGDHADHLLLKERTEKVSIV